MRAIIVDDEPLMITSFVRLSEDIKDLDLVASFESPVDAVEYTKSNLYEVAFLDIAMPEMSGIECANRIRQTHPDVIIVFISAFESFIKDSNQIGADYYILKPYSRETLEMLMPKLKLLQQRQRKSVSIQMFGRFVVQKDGDPVPLVGKTKEILALVATRCGKEISNEEIYSTIWETRTYDNVSMKVYYNALKRLKRILLTYGIPDLLISTARGQMLNCQIVDCDYFSWRKGINTDRDVFEGDFLPEYSWGEYILAEILEKIGITD